MKRSLFRSTLFPLGLTLVSLSLFAQEIEQKNFFQAQSKIVSSVDNLSTLQRSGEIIFKKTETEKIFNDHLSSIIEAAKVFSELSSQERQNDLILDLYELKDFLLFYLEKPGLSGWFVKTEGVLVDLPKKGRIEKIFIQEGLMNNFEGRDEKDQIFTTDRALIWKQAQIVSLEFKKRFIELRNVAPKRPEVRDLGAWTRQMGDIFKDRSEAPTGVRILLDR